MALLEIPSSQEAHLASTQNATWNSLSLGKFITQHLFTVLGGLREHFCLARAFWLLDYIICAALYGCWGTCKRSFVILKLVLLPAAFILFLWLTFTV